MTASHAISEIFWTAFRALPKKEKDMVLEKLLRDKELKEDLIDILIIEKRKKEPARSLDEYLYNREKKKYR